MVMQHIAMDSCYVHTYIHTSQGSKRVHIQLKTSESKKWFFQGPL